MKPDPMMKWERKQMNPPEFPHPNYETSDLNLASFLRCRDFPILDIQRQNGRAIFVFCDSPALRHAIVDFANDSSVNVRSFCNTLRDLKALTR